MENIVNYIVALIYGILNFLTGKKTRKFNIFKVLVPKYASIKYFDLQNSLFVACDATKITVVNLCS